jgi:molecular chaperone HscA
MPGESEAGCLLGVDVGTSNTVAVLRWPDGRTRPLLIGGQPLIPSAVHLGESGRLVAGRDAARMAQLDPSRHEPHPKARIDEQVVLLGDVEVPVVDLLAAILREVAAAAVEAVGFLPPAVLTHPAAWGPARRDLLQMAAGRAGWPPVSLVPEPVAAARYFADVLRRPVPVGSALAVFDFGGGTLDVAVVRNDGGHFAVLGCGGLEDLGGNDLDEALVRHLGETVAGSAPDVWQRLRAPRTQDDRRARRLFAEEVRGGKEMLSRSASAPVWVPGADQGAHVTRDEFERVAAPLLHRAVAETGAVIAGAGLHPSQLTSLFLVGGSSRVPLVARMLHADLGVAPTVLEQPELPVAEGALATVPLPATGSPVGVVAGSPVGLSSPAGNGGHRRPRRGFLRSPLTWAAAVLALVLAASGTAYAVLGSGTQDGFVVPLEPVGQLAMNDAARPAEDGDSRVASNQSTMAAGRVFFSVPMTPGKSEVVGAELSSGRELWRRTVNAELDDYGLVATGRALVLKDTSPQDNALEMEVLDAKTGKQLWTRPYSERDNVLYFDTFLLLDDSADDTLRKLDLRTGKELWTLAGDDGTTTIPVRTTADTNASADYLGKAFEEDLADDYRIVQAKADRSVQVVDVQNEEIVHTRQNVGDPNELHEALDGKLYYVTRDSAESPYQVDVYDLDTFDDPETVYRSEDETRVPSVLTPCGGGVCLVDVTADDDPGTLSSAQLVIAAGRGDPVVKEIPGANYLVTAGKNLLVANEDDTSLINLKGSVIVSFTGTVLRAGAARVVRQEGNPKQSSKTVKMTGYAPGSDKPVALGDLKIRTTSCSWSERYLACVTSRGYGIWRWTK